MVDFMIITWILIFIIVILLIDQIIIKNYQTSSTEQLLADLKNVTNIKLGKYQGRGIVIVINNHTFLQGLLNIHIIRFLGCNLPIQVFYDSLDESSLKYLLNLQAKCINLKEIYNYKESGADILSIVNSSFKEIIFISPDLIFFTNISELFNDENYIHYGALFWKDQDIKVKPNKFTVDWFNKILPFSTNDDNIILNKSGTSYQWGGLLLINKEIHYKTLQNLMIFYEHTSLINKYLYPKELYWLCAQLAQVPYYFINYSPGIIGTKNNKEICGNIMHYDSKGNILCFGGSIVSEDNIVSEFTHYCHFNNGAVWKKTIHLINSKCIQSENIEELPPLIKNLINDYKKILHNIRNKL